MSNETRAAFAHRPALPAALRLGPTHLTVTDLDRSVDFYERSIGLQLHRRDDPVAALGAGGEDLLVLVEEPGARPAGRHAGLYHVALLHPSRLELARAAARLVDTRTPISGASDHGISEAIYLPDPDGNGLELAADRPREAWPDLSQGWDGAPEPLDLESLFGLVEGERPLAQADAGLVVGHLHLHVGDLERGLAFYRDLLGFELMVTAPGALFLAAGGYHHHVGINVWRGQGVPPQPDGTAGLRHWTVVLPTAAQVDEVRARLLADGRGVEDGDGGFLVRDPWNLAVRFRNES
jgi:catechol 2,3-dioxygenase